MFYDPFSADFTEDLSGILNRAVCGNRQVLSGGLVDAAPTGPKGQKGGRNDSLKDPPSSKLRRTPHSFDGGPRGPEGQVF